MISRCCGQDVYIEGQECYYYVCTRCKIACEIKESPDADMGNDSRNRDVRCNATLARPWRLARLQSERDPHPQNFSHDICGGSGAYVGHW